MSIGKILIPFAVGIGVFAAAEYKASKGNTKEAPHVILVLGHKLEDNKPTEILKMRIKKAAEYMTENPDVVAIACGGKLESTQTISEAETIKNGLMEMGIDESRIILEDRSTTTRENFLNALEIINNMGIENVKVAMLSSEYHLLRGSLLAKKCALNVTTIAAPMPKNTKIKSYIRELICFVELLK